jgi:stage III sporulation protein AF
MAWLADWLKSIVFVILLAAFVDILLPNKTMQRYVKIVMSLFILLTLLQPVVSLVHKQNSIDEMFAGVATLFQSPSGKTAAAVFSSTQSASTDMQTLENIGQQAEQLKARQELQSRQLMQKQIGDLMKQNIEQASDMSVQSLQVETGKDTLGQMQILSVTLQAAQQPKKSLPASGQVGTANRMQIEPVKPVDISIKTDVKPTGSAKRENTVTGASSGYEQEKTQIRMLLNKVWQVPAERIVVEIVEGKAKL